MSYWLSFHMLDNTVIHVKYFHDILDTGEYEIECIWTSMAVDMKF